MRLPLAEQRQRHYVGPDVPGPELTIRRIGVGFAMPPVIVHRPAGTDDFLLMLFHDPVTVADHDGDHVLTTPAWILWRPGQNHCYGNRLRPWIHSWLHCTGSLIERHARHCPINRLQALDDSPRTLRHLVLLSDMVAHDPDPHLLRNAVDSLLTVLNRPMRSTGITLPEPWRELRRHLDQHFAEPLRAGTLAKRMGISPQHFTNMFQRYFGIGFRECLVQRRVDEALHLLRNANLSITAIAAAVGYDDPFQLSRLVRRRCGHSPRALRQRLLTAER